MQAPETPPDEAARLATLNRLKILDTPAEERFDRFTRICTRTFDMPIAVISLVDQYRQWFKSAEGLDATETPRDISFCGHAILGEDVFEVRNAKRDKRFRDNPLVKGDPNIRFYAGAPLAAPNGQKLGTLCLIDKIPRQLSDDEKSKLMHLAQMVVEEIVHFVDTDSGLPNRTALTALTQRHFESADRALEMLAIDACADNASTGAETAWSSDGEAFGELLKTHFPDAIMIAHWEGDRFCVLQWAQPVKDLEQSGADVVDETLRALQSQVADVMFVKRFCFSQNTHANVDALFAEVELAFANQD